MKKKRKQRSNRGMWSRFLLFLNVIAVVALLMSYLAPFVNPDSFWPLAFFGIAYFFILLANILFAAYWVFLRSYLSLISIVTIILGYHVFLKHAGFHQTPSAEVIAKADDAHIRVLSYNVHLFRETDSDIEPVAKKGIVEVIKKVSPDIVCIQEFYTRKKGKNNIRKYLADELGMPNSYFHPVVSNDYESYGLIIFSKFPIRTAGFIPSYGNKNSLNKAIYADIVRNGRSFRIYNVHLQSIGFKPEDYAFVKKKLKENNLDDDLLASKRIGGKLKRAFIDRSEQAILLKQELNRCRQPFILTGDFNDTPQSFSVNHVSEGLNNSFRAQGRGWGVTYNGDFPNFQIDYILSTAHFSVKHYQIIKKKISDHYAIWSDLEMK